MHIIYPLLISSIAGLSTVIGAFLIFLKIKPVYLNKFISFCLAFSLSIMLSISIFDLIPSSFFPILTAFGLRKTVIILLFSFLISYIVITLLNTLIKKETENQDLFRLGILNMLVLILHNLPEGIATFLSSYHDIHLGLKLGIAIMLHNIPEGISIAIPIYYSTKSKYKAFKTTFLSGLAEPIGAILAFLFLKNYVSNLMVSIVLIIVAGLMITLSIQEILPASLKYHENKFIYLGFLIGLLIFSLNFILTT